MQKIAFDRHRFPPDLIIHSEWLDAKYTLSYRDVEDPLAERGLDVSCETVRRWFLKFGDQIASRLRSKQPPPSDHWHLDKMVIVVCGKRSEGVSERCSGSNHENLPSVFSTFMPPHTITSTTNVILSAGLCSRN